MADALVVEEKEVPSDDVKKQDDVDETVVEGPKDLEEAKALLTKQSEALTLQAELLKKVRKYEKENKEKADAAMKEQGKYKELYDAESEKRIALETKTRNLLVGAAIETVLKEKGVTAVSTVKKLIDRSKVVVGDDDSVDTTSITAQLDELKKSDPILFGAVTKVPDVKRPGDGEPTSGYEKEMRAARSQKEIEAVMKKYGKL